MDFINTDVQKSYVGISSQSKRVQTWPGVTSVSQSDTTSESNSPSFLGLLSLLTVDLGSFIPLAL